MPKYYADKHDFKIVLAAEFAPYIEEARRIHFDADLCLAVVWLTGCRIKEAVNLRRGDVTVDTVERSLMFSVKALKFGKMGYPSFLFSVPFVEGVILPALEGKAPEARLLSCGKRRYQQVLEEVNLRLHGNAFSKWLTFHQLRHSRITFLARVLRASPEELKAWTGHRSAAYEEYFQPRRVDRFRGEIR